MAKSDANTSGGVELTDEQLDTLADDAERGYGSDRLRARSRRGRPPLEAEAAEVFHVRLPPSLRQALERAADAEQTTPSDVLRRALSKYLELQAEQHRRASSA